MLYYPGCTVKTTAQPYEKATIGVLKEFGIDVVEIERWVCCGVYPGLTKDNYYYLVAPIRNLIWAQEQKKRMGIDNNYVLTVCSMCFNTLKSAHMKYVSSEEVQSRVLAFLNDEPKYEGKMEVVHIMEVLDRLVSLEKIKEKIVNDLKGLKIAPFYGCYLLRPRGVGIDDPEKPTIMERLLKTLGAEPIDYPYKNRCCGGYLVTKDPDAVWDRVQKIAESAIEQGAKIFVTTCPLCAFNLEMGQKHREDKLSYVLPVFFEPELVAYAIGRKDLIEPDRLKILEDLINGS